MISYAESEKTVQTWKLNLILQKLLESESIDMLKQQNLKVGKCKKIIAQSKMPQRKPRPWVKFFHRKNFKYIDTYGTNKKKE